MRTHYFFILSISCSIILAWFRLFYYYLRALSTYLFNSETVAAYFSPLSVKSVFYFTKPLYEFLSVLYSAFIVINSVYKSPIFFDDIDYYTSFFRLVYFLLLFLLLLSVGILDDMPPCKYGDPTGKFFCDYLFDTFLSLSFAWFTYGLMAFICLDSFYLVGFGWDISLSLDFFKLIWTLAEIWLLWIWELALRLRDYYEI